MEGMDFRGYIIINWGDNWNNGGSYFIRDNQVDEIGGTSHLPSETDFSRSITKLQRLVEINWLRL